TRPHPSGRELTYQPLDLPVSHRAVHDLTVYSAEPGTPNEDRLTLLASWGATRARTADPSHEPL
ncbi:transcriptional regulator, partial [Streptomyces sp. NPDC057456]